MENENQVKLIFGLSPKSTIINSIVLLFISQLSWALVFTSQIPAGVDYNNLPTDLTDNVSWYYYLPTNILSLIMAISWVEYTFKIEKTDFSWRAIKYKYLYLIASFVILQAIYKFIILFIILSLK